MDADQEKYGRRRRGAEKGRVEHGYPSSWSEWEWNEEHQCQVRYRLRRPGDYEFDYRSVHPPNVPKDPQVDAAYQSYTSFETNPEDEVSTHTNYYGTSSAGGYASHYSSPPVSCPDPSCQQTFGNTNDRDRHYRTVHSNNGERPYTCDRVGCPADVKSWTTAGKLRAHNNKWHGPYSCSEPRCSRRFPHGFGSQMELDGHLKADHGLAQDFGEPSSEIYAAYPKNKALTDYSAVPEDNADAIVSGMAQTSLAPTSSEPNSNHRCITVNTTTTAEKIDPRYKVRPSKQFTWGLVFKVLWSEPEGSMKRKAVKSDGESEYEEIPFRDGENAFVKTRRFVVIDTRSGHSICLPISTYGGRGTLKPGVHSDDHAAIYTSTSEPVLAHGEELMRKPISIKLSAPRERLDPMSRLNYAKLYTVEHNVKIFPIGKVDENSEYQLTADYNRVHPPMTPRGAPSSGDDVYDYQPPPRIENQAKFMPSTGDYTEDSPMTYSGQAVPLPYEDPFSGSTAYHPRTPSTVGRDALYPESDGVTYVPTTSVTPSFYSVQEDFPEEPDSTSPYDRESRYDRF